MAQYRDLLAKDQIYVRRYDDLLDMVKRMHREFIERYNELRERVKA